MIKLVLDQGGHHLEGSLLGRGCWEGDGRKSNKRRGFAKVAEADAMGK